MQSPYRYRAVSKRHFRSLCGLAVLLAAPSLVSAATPNRADAVPMDGTVTVVHVDDFVHDASRLEYQFEDRLSGRRATLRFDGEPPAGLHTASRIVGLGTTGNDGSILLSADSVSIPAAQPTIRTATSAQATAAMVVSGVQNTLVIVANFTDATVAPTVSQIQNIMFSDPNGQSIDALFRETSFDNVGFTGQVAGPFTINYSTTSPCDMASWANAAEAAATSAGINLAAYPRKLYVMPSAEMSVCGADGAGQVGGSPSRAWVFNNLQSDVYAHELGHNLNMAHAATLANQYGDASDDMSADGYALRHFNAPHMEQMGWTPASNILTVTASGTYTVAALETDPTLAPAPQILKIAKPDTGEYYYFSYRQPVGIDSGLRSAYWNRVNVHKYTGAYDATNTYLLQLLDDASVFSDSTNGITVTQVSHAADRATVQIQVPASGGTCQRATPILTVSPASQSGLAGSTLAYTMTLVNQDSTHCAASTFNLASALPSGWSGSLSASTLNLAAGASGTATLSLTSASSAAAATYSATVNVSDATTAAHAQSGSAAYVVQAQCTRAAPTITFAPASLSGTAGTSLGYTVAIANRDSASCAASTLTLGNSAPVGWTVTLSPTTMSLSPGATSNATVVVKSPANAAAGTYTVQVKTSDSTTSVHTASGNGNDVVQGDTQAPTAPKSLAATVRRGQVSLSWGASADNVAVAGYEVWRNGAKVSSTTATAYSETPPAGTYTYSVIAYDAAGNRSAASNTVSVNAKGH